MRLGAKGPRPTAYPPFDSDTAYPDRPIPGAAAPVLPFMLSFAPMIYDTVELGSRLCSGYGAVVELEHTSRVQPGLRLLRKFGEDDVVSLPQEALQLGPRGGVFGL